MPGVRFDDDRILANAVSIHQFAFHLDGFIVGRLVRVDVAARHNDERCQSGFEAADRQARAESSDGRETALLFAKARARNKDGVMVIVRPVDGLCAIERGPVFAFKHGLVARGLIALVDHQKIEPQSAPGLKEPACWFKLVPALHPWRS